MELGSVLNKLQEYIDVNLLNNKNAFKDLFEEYNTKPVGEHITEVNTVANHIPDIDNVMPHVDVIHTVSDNINNVNNVGSNINNVLNVDSNSININTVSNNISDVKSNATNMTDINTVADYIKDGTGTTHGGQYLGEGVTKPVEYFNNVLTGAIVLKENLSAMAIDHLIIENNSSFTIESGSVFKII